MSRELGVSHSAYNHLKTGRMKAGRKVLGGVPRIRLYDLRHTSASLLLASGVHPKIVSERLGHASVNLTLSTYSHVLPGLQQDAADTLEAALKEAK